MLASMAGGTIEHIFVELRYYEDRARSDEETRDTRLATLIALSGAVLGLLVASLPDEGSTPGVIAFCCAAVLFTCALLVATQFALLLPGIAQYFGGSLEPIPEVDLAEFTDYLTPEFQAAEKTTLQTRVLPAMNSAIGARRRNAARKERCLRVAVLLIAIGVFATAAYASILVI